MNAQCIHIQKQLLAEITMHQCVYCTKVEVVSEKLKFNNPSLVIVSLDRKKLVYLHLHLKLSAKNKNQYRRCA